MLSRYAGPRSGRMELRGEAVTPIHPIPDEEAFLGRVGHDLRGELATMVAGIHYLMRYERGLSDAGKQMLERVNGAGGRLRRLLDELEHAAWIKGRPPGPL